MLIVLGKCHVFVASDLEAPPPTIELKVAEVSFTIQRMRLMTAGDFCWATYNHNLDWMAVTSRRVVIQCGVFSSVSSLSDDGWLITFAAIEDFSILTFASPMSTHGRMYDELNADIDGIELPLSFSDWRLTDEMVDDGIRVLCLDMPPWVLDGLEHRITFKTALACLHSEVYRSDFIFYIESSDPGILRGWCFDRSQRDTPSSMVLGASEFRRTVSSSILPPDIASRYGRRYGGFELEFDRSPSGLTQVRVGHDGQVPFLQQFSPNGRAVSLESFPSSLSKTVWCCIDHPYVDVSQISSPDFSFTLLLATRRITCIMLAGEDKGRLESSINFMSDLLMSDIILEKVIIVYDQRSDTEVVRRCGEFCATWPAHVISTKIDGRSSIAQCIDAGLSVWNRQSDVLLLRPGTVLSLRSLRKLRWSLFSTPGIASISPLSNNGSLLCYPDKESGQAMQVTEAMELDRVSERLFRGQVIDIPVSIDLCTLIKAESIDVVGAFDRNSGPGDGGTDWCLRAGALGFRHTAALDCFAWYGGSISDDIVTRRNSVRSISSSVERRRVDYQSLIDYFITLDPLGEVRLTLFFESIPLDLSLLLHFCHNLGGGTFTYVENLVKMAEAHGHLSLRFSLESGGGHPTGLMICDQTGEIVRFRPDHLARLIERLSRRKGRVSVIVHSLIGIQREWVSAVQSSRLPITIILHDYQWYCPRAVLINGQDEYCGEPEPAVCDICISMTEYPEYPGSEALIAESVSAWVDFNDNLLRSAHKVIAPSHGVARRYRSKFPNISITTLSHQYVSRSARISHQNHPAGQALTIAVVGGINVAKGCNWVAEICREIDHSARNIRVVVVGSMSNIDKLERWQCFKATGPYSINTLPELLLDLAADFVLFPSIWPETFCYVLSEIWQSGYCPVARDIGAVAERIRETGAGVLLDPDLSPKQFIDNIDRIVHHCRALDGFTFSFGDNLNDTSYLGEVIQ